MAPQLAEYGIFDMVLGGDDYSKVICSIEPDAGDSGRDSASCSAVVRVAAHDTVRVQFFQGTDRTPLHLNAQIPINGFSGFRI